MELPSRILEQIAFNTRPTIEEQRWIFMDKSTHEEHLSQPLQTNNKQFKMAITFLSGCNGIFNVTDTNNKSYFTKSISDEDGSITITIPLVLTNSRIWIMKLKEILLIKNITPNPIIHLQSNQTFQHLGLIMKYPVKDQ